MLTYTIIHNGVARDVTAHIEGAPELGWNAVGGCETASVRIDLPLVEFPGLGRRSRLAVTDRMGRPVWEGYCTDPGGVSDDAGEAFDLVADGSLAAASLRVGRLVYADPDLSSWTRAKASVDSASVGQVDDEELTGWRIGHPQGQAIGTGALAGIEYRQLARSDQGIGRLRATVTGHANDSGFTVIVATYTAGTVTDSISWPLAAGSTVLDLVAGDEITAGCDAVQIGIARAGGATNVTTDLAYIEVTGLTVEGSTLDRYGAPTTPGAPITSAAVVADLIGRGMLGPIDPDAAVIEDSGVVHSSLSWATGIRGAAALEELREADPGMTWMYGTRGPGGLAFAWQAWGAGADAVRYDLTDQDTITASGTSELPGDRVLVIWTEDGTEHSLIVTDPETADDEYARDLDPISLGESTAAEAETAGREALTAAADAGRTITGVVNRAVLDRATGLLVEPWEVRPGCLARLEASGEVLRVQEVSYRDRDAGGLVELTLGAPPADLTSRMLRVIRGEVDPTAPLIPAVPYVPDPPVLVAPVPPVIGELGDALDELEQDLTELTTVTLPGVQQDLSDAELELGELNGKFPITSTNISDNAITTPKILAGAVDADRIASNAVTAAKIVGLSITGDKIAANTIGAEKITALSIGAAELAAGAVTTAKLAAGAITADKIAAGAITADKVSAGALNGVTIDGATITGGFVRTWFHAASQTGAEMSGFGFAGYNAGNLVTYHSTAGNILATVIDSTGAITGAGAVTGLELYSTSDTGTTSADAEFGSGGRVKRKSSTRRVKEDIEPMTLDEARKILAAEEATFYYRDREQYGDRRYSGGIAEQFADAGLDLWVTRDANGEPDGIRYAELTVPLIAIARDHEARLAALEAAT